MLMAGALYRSHAGVTYEIVGLGTWTGENLAAAARGVVIYKTETQLLVCSVEDFLGTVRISDSLNATRFEDANAERKICRECGDWTAMRCSSCETSLCEKCVKVHEHRAPA